MVLLAAPAERRSGRSDAALTKKNVHAAEKKTRRGTHTHTHTSGDKYAQSPEEEKEHIRQRNESREDGETPHIRYAAEHTKKNASGSKKKHLAHTTGQPRKAPENEKEEGGGWKRSRDGNIQQHKHCRETCSAKGDKKERGAATNKPSRRRGKRKMKINCKGKKRKHHTS